MQTVERIQLSLNRARCRGVVSKQRYALSGLVVLECACAVWYLAAAACDPAACWTWDFSTPWPMTTNVTSAVMRSKWIGVLFFPPVLFLSISLLWFVDLRIFFQHLLRVLHVLICSYRFVENQFFLLKRSFENSLFFLDYSLSVAFNTYHHRYIDLLLLLLLFLPDKYNWGTYPITPFIMFTFLICKIAFAWFFFFCFDWLF